MRRLTDAFVIGSLDERVIATMRVVLAVLAILSTYIDPVETTHYVVVTYTVLTLHLTYSSLLCVQTIQQRPWLSATLTYWVDMGWYILLIGVSKGTNSIFVLFLFFTILVASFQWGFRSGLRVTVVAAVLFTCVGFAMAPAEPEFELNSFLLRPTSLLVLGYMIACWGGAETTLRRRLALLKDINLLSNPRFGVDRMLGTLLERLRDFYAAELCLLVMTEPQTGGHSLRRVSRQNPATDGRVARLAPEVSQLLLAIPTTHALVCGSAPRVWGWFGERGRVQAYEVVTGLRLPTSSSTLPAMLASEAALTIPVRYRDDTVGRLYLTAEQRRTFDVSDIDFLLQVFHHTMPTIDNIRLVDRLASDAAEAERQRIARDLHDSIIQPYIGFQMGLAAIQQKLLLRQPEVENDVERLLALTTAGLMELRHYMGDLKEPSGQEHRATSAGLVPAVRRFAAKFVEATGILVQVEAETTLPVNDRLAAEVFQMVAEGLSNVRRHTQSACAWVHLACDNDHLIVGIANDLAGGRAPTPFTPRSITARAEALGGKAMVTCPSEGRTVVTVHIPL